MSSYNEGRRTMYTILNSVCKIKNEINLTIKSNRDKFEYNNKEKTDKTFKQSLFLVPFKSVEEMTEWAVRVFGIDISSIDINK